MHCTFAILGAFHLHQNSDKSHFCLSSTFMLKKDRSEIYLSFDVNGKHLLFEHSQYLHVLLGLVVSKIYPSSAVFNSTLSVADLTCTYVIFTWCVSPPVRLRVARADGVQSCRVLILALLVTRRYVTRRSPTKHSALPEHFIGTVPQSSCQNGGVGRRESELRGGSRANVRSRAALHESVIHGRGCLWHGRVSILFYLACRFTVPHLMLDFFEAVI